MTTYELQLLLTFLKYNTGGVDDKYGPKTEQAVRDFQEEYGGLKADGKAGDLTKAAIRKAIGEGWARSEKGTEVGPELGPTDDWDKIKYFKREEFACKCGGQYCNGFPVEPDKQLVQSLDWLRKNGVSAFSPNSAIRCKRWNEIQGGAKNSQHLYGRAADIPAKNKTPQQLADMLETRFPNSGGIGIYSWGIHVDTRKDKARWRG